MFNIAYNSPYFADYILSWFFVFGDLASNTGILLQGATQKNTANQTIGGIFIEDGPR